MCIKDAVSSASMSSCSILYLLLMYSIVTNLSIASSDVMQSLLIGAVSKEEKLELTKFFFSCDSTLLGPGTDPVAQELR